MTDLPAIRFQRLPHGNGLPLPAYQSAGAAAFDLSAAIPEGEPVTIAPGEMFPAPTGFFVAVPDGYELQVRPRSSLPYRHQIGILNSPGTIDCDYRGEIFVMLHNHGQQPFVLERGNRIAQCVVAPAPQHPITEVETLDDTKRGQGAFGSTGR